MLVIPGALLLIGNVAVLIWRDPPHPDQLMLGGILAGVGWALFLVFSLNFLRLGRLFSNLGLIGPLALIVLLLVGDVLLLTSFLDILPSWDVTRNAIESGLKDFLPFVD